MCELSGNRRDNREGTYLVSFSSNLLPTSIRALPCCSGLGIRLPCYCDGVRFSFHSLSWVRDTDKFGNVQVGFKVFLNITPTVTNWTTDNKQFSLIFEENPLADFVELPDDGRAQNELWYSNMLCGVVRGALEMVSGRRYNTFLPSLLRPGVSSFCQDSGDSLPCARPWPQSACGEEIFFLLPSTPFPLRLKLSNEVADSKLTT